MQKKFEDCYVSYENDLLSIGNSKIERKIKFHGNIPVSLSLESGKDIWSGGVTAMFNITKFDFENAERRIDAYISDFGGESSSALIGEVLYKTDSAEIKQIFYVFPETEAVSYKLYGKGEIIRKEFDYKSVNTAIEGDADKTFCDPVLPLPDVVDSLNINETHIKVDAIRLSDETDVYNELVCHDERILYGRHNEYLNGSIFLIDNYIDDKSMLVVSEGYVSGKKFHGDKDLMIKKRAAICVFGNGADGSFEEFTYVGGTTVVCGKKDELTKGYRAYYRKMYKNSEMYIMSNTWGDRNRDTAVCEEFILKELDVAYTLGVDILQIDDGWQKGISENSGFTAHGAWGNFYETDSNFWEINKEKFPNGFSVVTDYAKERNIRIGLWFSMDKDNGYASWERDAHRLLELHKKHGVCYFKIDGLVISDHKCEENIF